MDIKDIKTDELINLSSDKEFTKKEIHSELVNRLINSEDTNELQIIWKLILISKL